MNNLIQILGFMSLGVIVIAVGAVIGYLMCKKNIFGLGYLNIMK